MAAPGVAGVLVAGGALAATGGAAGPAVASAAASTTTTSNPWVPGTGGTLTLGIDQAPTGCDPNSTAGDTWANRLVLDAVLPSAFVVNGDNQAVYDASVITQAELQSTTPETVVYTINPKAVWSDGTPITARDFVATWAHARGSTGTVGATPGGTSPSTTSDAGTTVGATTGPGSGAGTGASTTAGAPTAPVSTAPGATATTGPAVGYRQVASVTGSNHGRTVTVVFKTPYNDWQSLFNYLLPARVLARSGGSPHCTTVSPSVDLSGGPFAIAKVVPGHEVVLDRNPRWWGQLPDLDRLVVKVASGPAQLAQWLSRGVVQVALPTSYDPQFLQRVSSAPGLTSQSQLSTSFLQLDFSTTAPATAPVGVRTALAHLIDRQALINGIVGWADSSIVPGASHLYAQNQGGYPAHKPPPPQVSGQPGYSAPTPAPTGPTATPFPPTADPTTANRLLLSLGYLRVPAVGPALPGAGVWELPSGKPFTVRLAVDNGDPWAAAAAAMVVHQLEAAGVGVTTVAATSAQATGLDLSTGAADLAVLPMHASPFPTEAIAWYTKLLGAPGSGGSQDWTNLSDSTVTSLLVRASQQLNPVDAGPMYTQADKALWADMVGLPLFTEPTILAWSNLTAGVSPSPDPAALLSAPELWSMRVPPTSRDTAPGG